MSFSAMPEDMVLLIWEFVRTNKDMLAMRSCCTYFKRIGDTWGYLKNIMVSVHMDYMKFISLYGRYARHPLTLTFAHRVTPTRWIPYTWPTSVMFVDCFMGRERIDPPVSPTTALDISHGTTSTLRLKWQNLPRLKSLSVRADDVDFTGIEHCTELETVDLHLASARAESVPRRMRSLPNLRRVSCNNIVFFFKKNSWV